MNTGIVHAGGLTGDMPRHTMGLQAHQAMAVGFSVYIRVKSEIFKASTVQRNVSHT